MEIEVVVYGVVLDPTSNSPVIILKDELTNRILPIWIGIFEANAIAMKLENVSSPRPMTHDLLASIIRELGGKVVKVVVNDLREGTFYGKIHIMKDNGEILMIDSRPSDAIALAVRLGAPVFVEEKVFEEASILPAPEGEGEQDLKEWLEGLSPEDFGKYKM